MRSNSRRLRAAAAALAAVALVAVGPGAATADDNNSVKDFLSSVAGGQSPSQDQTGGSQDATGGTPAPSTTSDDDSPGHETADPKAPDHGRATVGDAKVKDQDLATVGDSNGTVNDDDSTKADSTLLAIGGQEIIGAHADSKGTQESHAGDPLAPLCDGSGGQVCLRLLYADAWATDDGNTSHSKGQSGVADACLGGSETGPEAECTGPVHASVLSSKGQSDRDQASGRTTAGSESQVAGVCLQKDATTGHCALGAGALDSKGQSDSGGSQASASRDSYLVAIDGNGKEQGRYSDPTDASLPPGCPTGQALLCLFLNQGETYVGDGAAGHAQEALHAGVLPGNLDLMVHLARSETLVHNDGGEASGPTPSTGSEGGTAAPGGSGGPGTPGAGGGVLPNTGGVWSGLLALGLGGVGVGSLLVAYGRRRGLGLV